MSFRAPELPVQANDNMLLDIWKKFVLLSGTSGMTASTRKSLGLIREDECGWRRLAGGLCNGVGAIDSGLTSNYESINCERPRGWQAP
jgi:ketopantoate reductase